MSKKKYNDTEEWFRLIPELKEWNNGYGIDHEDWVGIMGKVEYALAYTSMFWPKFILFKDCVFIEDINEQIFNNWYKNCEGNLTSVEATVNHRHLDSWSNGEHSQEQMEYLGEVLKDMWETKLIRQFPNRKITVALYENMGEYTITVYQEKH